MILLMLVINCVNNGEIYYIYIIVWRHGQEIESKMVNRRKQCLKEKGKIHLSDNITY